MEGELRHSSRVWGAVALGAIVTTAVCLAVVDVSVENGCRGTLCTGDVPLVAIVFAGLGGITAAVSIIPMMSWLVAAVRSAWHTEPERDREFARAARVRRASFGDDPFGDEDF